MTSPLLAAAEGLQELVEAHADKAEQQRRLPKRLVQGLRDAQLLRMCVPAAYGGPEADILTMVRAIETIAVADGAAGWCTMIASTTSSMSLFLEPDWARAIFGDPKSIAGGVYAPNGRGERVDGGWKVTGSWSWGSGSQHCAWVSGGTVTDDGGFHLMFFEASDVTIHDTWYSMGLRGTGSHDFSVDGAFVPDGRSVQPRSATPRVEGALAAFPNFSLLASGVAAVSLGVARHAIDEAIDIAQGKKPLFSSRTISQVGSAQSDLARAEASVRAARAFLHDELGTAWDTAASGGQVDLATRARIRLACVHAADICAKAVDVAYTMCGGSSVYETSPLQRCLRDAHVATQHLMVAPRMYETMGKHLFGHEVDSTTI